jgi:hypothetical protein
MREFCVRHMTNAIRYVAETIDTQLPGYKIRFVLRPSVCENLTTSLADMYTIYYKGAATHPVAFIGGWISKLK